MGLGLEGGPSGPQGEQESGPSCVGGDAGSGQGCRLQAGAAPARRGPASHSSSPATETEPPSHKNSDPLTAPPPPASHFPKATRRHSHGGRWGLGTRAGGTHGFRPQREFPPSLGLSSRGRLRPAARRSEHLRP